MSTVLYEPPGPRAKARNRITNILVLVVLVGAVAWLINRMYQNGQFEGRLWRQFQYSSIQQQLVEGLLNTLRAAGLAAVLALLFGAVFAAARISDHKWIRTPATLIVELFRAVPLLILMFYFYFGNIQFQLGLSPFWAVVFGLTLYNGSVLAEIFRAGIAAGIEPASATENPAAIVVFFSNAMNTLISGGMIARNACGRTTIESTWLNDMPIARAASDWPGEIVLTPDRTTSQTNADV